MTWEALAPYSVHKGTPCIRRIRFVTCRTALTAVCEAVSGRVLPRCQRRIVSQAGGAVDLLPQDVGVTGVPCDLLDHVRHDPSQRDRVGYAGIGDGGHGGQIEAGPHDLVAAGTRLPAGGDDLVAGGAGDTVMDMSMSWSWPRKTRWNQCSSTPVRCLMRPSRLVPDGTSGVRCCSAVSPADTRTTVSRTLVRKYNSTSRSDSATSRPALSLTLMPPEIRAYPRGRPPANAGHREIGATVAGQGAVTGDHRASQPEPPQLDAERQPPRHAAAHPGGHQHSPQDVYQ